MTTPTAYDNNVGNVRTTVNTAWVTALAFGLSHLFGWNIDLTDPVVIALIPAIATVVWRISNVVSQHVPWIGYVLFGVNRSPGYTSPPPGMPVVAEAPPDDRGQSLTQVLIVVVLVLGAIALGVWLVRELNI